MIISVLRNYSDFLSKVTQVQLSAIEMNEFYSSVYFKSFQEATVLAREHASLYKTWLDITETKLDAVLRLDSFTSTLSKFVNSLVDLLAVLRNMGYPVLYMDWLLDMFVRGVMVFASLSKDYDLDSFDVIYGKGKMRLLHYHHAADRDKVESSIHRTPLLLVYAPINKFHIMDVAYDRSVVRNLLSNGLDVYLIDWGFPDWRDSNLSFDDYINFVEESVQIIREKSEWEKISVLGYCWGGIISLCYAANHNENLKNLSIMAAPVDFSKDKTILAIWSRVLDTNKIINEFGHLDGGILDLGFLMRNPFRYTIDKYFNLMCKWNDSQFLDTFLRVEKWLHNTPIVPGNVFTRIINDGYKNNLLIANKMIVCDKQVDLRKITVPILSIVAEDDDLVSPEATLAINDFVSSKDKRSIKIPGGHVGLCISRTAHRDLWPEVAKWVENN